MASFIRPRNEGGTAACHVVISEEQIGSPILNSATALIAMNNPSLEKFENMVVEGGVIITDSSLADKSSKRKDVSVSEIPATNMARKWETIHMQ